jgi:hypothetical protein
MRTTSRLVVALGTVLALFAAAAGTVAAAGISVSPTCGAAGSSATVSGSGFTNTTVNVLFGGSGGTNIGSMSTSGDFSGLSVTIPTSAAVGDNTIFATDGTSTATTGFTVIGNVGGASLSLNPTSGAAGSSVTLTGSGFSASEHVNLTVGGDCHTGHEDHGDQDDHRHGSAVTSDSGGNFTTTIKLSSLLSQGVHTLSATDRNGSHSAVATFSVTSSPVATQQCPGDNGDSRPGNGNGNGNGDDNHCHGDNQGNGDGQGENES